MLIGPDTYRNVLDWLRQNRVIALDTETTGLDVYGKRRDRICGLVLGNAHEQFYLPFRHATGPNLPLNRLCEILHELSADVANGTRTIRLWNAKFDLHMMMADGFRLPPETDRLQDFMLGIHLLNENEPSFGLKQIADKYKIGQGSKDETELRGQIQVALGLPSTAEKTWKGYLYKVPAAMVEPYACSDARLTWLVADLALPSLARAELSTLFDDVNRYNVLITRMEHRGVLLDRDMIDRQMQESTPKLRETEASIRQLIAEPLADAQSRCTMPAPKIGKRGQPLKIPNGSIPIPLRLTPDTFNPGSPSQLLAIFDHWPKTDVAYLESIDASAPDHAIANAILDYRVLSKLNGTYYEAYLELIGTDDAIRPNYNLHGTVNGRASCSKPNLQNVPRYTPRRPVKDVFIARPGYVLIEVDYAQAELRIACHYGKEHRMGRILQNGGDPHGETAQALGISRHAGKTLNFLIIYGGGVRALTKLLKCDEQTAQRYLRQYHALYPGFARLAHTMQERAERDGFIRMETGRRRRFDTWKKYAWEAESRKAMNSLIQGTAAEMLRISMQRLDRRIRGEGIDAHLLLQVHDSLMIESREDEVSRVLAILRPEMTGYGFIPCPDIDAKIGQRWGQLQEVSV